MSCSINISASQLAVSPSVFRVQAVRFNNASTCTSAYFGTRLPKVPLKLTYAKPRHQQAAIVCLFGKGKSEDGDEFSPWKALEKTAGNFRKNSSIEDLLKQQIEKKDYYDDIDDFDDIDDGDGGSGGKRGGGGGGGGGYVGPEDEGLAGLLDEIFQVTMTILGLLFLYLYILDPEKVTVWTKDILAFIFMRKVSFRLRPVFDKIKWCLKQQRKIKKKKAARPPDYLERKLIRAILRTTPRYPRNKIPKMSRKELLRTVVAQSRANA